MIKQLVIDRSPPTPRPDLHRFHLPAFSGDFLPGQRHHLRHRQASFTSSPPPSPLLFPSPFIPRLRFRFPYRPVVSCMRSCVRFFFSSGESTNALASKLRACWLSNNFFFFIMLAQVCLPNLLGWNSFPAKQYGVESAPEANE